MLGSSMFSSARTVGGGRREERSNGSTTRRSPAPIESSPSGLRLHRGRRGATAAAVPSSFSSSDEDDEDDDDDEDEEEEKPAKPSGPPPKIKVTKDMIKAERFRHVVEALIKQGVKSKSQLIKICNKIKDQVPCVAKVSNIEERVQSCLEMIGTTLAD